MVAGKDDVGRDVLGKSVPEASSGLGVERKVPVWERGPHEGRGQGNAAGGR